MPKTKILLLSFSVFFFFFLFHFSLALASDCSCGSNKVVLGSYGLEDQCRKDCKTKGYSIYNYGTSSNNSVDTQIQESNPSNLGGGCYCDGTYFANLGNEAGCKSYCSEKKKQNYNYENTGNKATGYTAPQANTPSSSSNFDYKIMEGIPGILKAGQTYTFNEYVSGVYRFALWAVGICALLMISIGAFMYLTSAGNNAAMGKAKEVITDALIGLILALVAWLMLNIINPDLVSPKGITGTGGTTTPAINTKNSGNTLSNSFLMQKVSSNVKADGTVDFDKAKTDTGIKTSKNCDNYDFTNSSGVDKAKLKTIAHLETSGCTNTKAISSKGCCGLMQLNPDTATKMNGGKTVACADLNDPKTGDALSIKLAAKYVAANEKNASELAPNNPDAATFAGYNSGYSTTAGSSVSGKNPALAKSVNCPGARAFECSKNPGGLTESISYAYNGVGLYEQYKKQK